MRREARGTRRVVGSIAIAMAISMAMAGCGDRGAPETVTRPRPISVESPFRYPVALWDTDIQGETVVMVHVTDTGDVDSVYVEQASGHAAFDSAAVTGAYELKFAPGRRGDRRIDMWARLPVRFRKSAPVSGGTE